MDILKNLFPKTINEINIFRWTGQGKKDILVKLHQISDTEIVVKTNEEMPSVGDEGVLSRPFFHSFPAKITESYEDGFKAEFMQVGIQNKYRKIADEQLAELVAAHNSTTDFPDTNRPTWLSRQLLSLYVRLGMSLPNLERRTYTREEFPWTAKFEKDWRVIRTELENVFNQVGVEGIKDGSEMHKSWHKIVLAEHGKISDEALKVFPGTSELLSHVPSLAYASFSILQPGAAFDYHMAVSRVYLRMHIPVIIPEGDTYLQIEDIKYPWTEGKISIFDEYYPHHAWNNTNETRAILLLDFIKPMPSWKKLIFDLMDKGSKPSGSIPSEWLKWEG